MTRAAATTMQILTKRTFGGAVLAIAAVVGACALFGPPDPPSYEPFTTASGVVVQDETVPESTSPIEPGQIVTMHLVLKLTDGTVVDDTEERGQPIEFVYGEPIEQLPPAFSEGLVGLHNKQRRSLFVPAEAAFGAAGVPGVIPPDADLRAVIEVLDARAPATDA